MDNVEAIESKSDEAERVNELIGKVIHLTKEADTYKKLFLAEKRKADIMRKTIRDIVDKDEFYNFQLFFDELDDICGVKEDTKY